MGETKNAASRVSTDKVSDVKSIRERFEAQMNSLKTASTTKSVKKVPPPVPQKPILFRSKTMRDSSTMQHRKALLISEVSESASLLLPNSSSLFTKLTRNSESAHTESERHTQSDPVKRNSVESSDDEVKILEPERPRAGKVEMIIKELLENEAKYVEKLEKGIETYIGGFKSVHLPASLVGRKFLVFSNIELIYEFHERKFLPELLESGHDPEKIANVFISNIESYSFDQYIGYAQNKLRSLEIIKKNQDFFDRFNHDGLGISSFLLQPIQRLPRYQLIFCELIKELVSDDVTENKASITRCCRAEKALEKLLTIVDEQCS